MKPSSGISFALFLGGLLCFLLPFITVSCGGQQVATFTGVQLATGSTVDQPQVFGPSQKKELEAEPFATIAGLFGVAGMAFSFSRRNRAAIVPAIAAAAGTISLLLMKARMEQQVASHGNGVLQVNYEMGFYLSLMLFVAGAAWNGFVFTQETPNSIATAPSVSQAPEATLGGP